MRLWTVHPRYLDRQGLTALWREGILAQTVLCGETKGYTHHPQLQRFRDLRSPVAGIATYLEAVYAESIARGYHFNHSLIRTPRMRKRIPETHGHQEPLATARFALEVGGAKLALFADEEIYVEELCDDDTSDTSSDPLELAATEE